MNTARIKLLAWTAAGILGLGLSLYVAWFVSRFEQVEGAVTRDRMKEVLENVPEIVAKADDIVAYDEVAQAMIDLDWTGKPRVKDAPPPVVDEPIRTPDKRVEELLVVLWIAFDAEAPDESRCLIRYKPAAQVPPPATAGREPAWVKGVGDPLDGNHGGVRVFAIHPDRVEFAFDNESREHESVRPREISLSGLFVLDDESQLVERPSTIYVPRVGARREALAKTTQLDRNRFQLGYEDAEYINQNFSEILARDVRYARHRNPDTGRYDGIQLMEVKPGSLVEAHGVQTGDVVMSINGHPVTSTQEAISYVKNNQDNYDKWEVVVLSKGQLKTMTYYSPQK